MSLTSFEIILLDCIVTAVISMWFFKNQNLWFCVVILILKIKENKWHFQHIMLYYSKKGKNATEMQKYIYLYSVWRRFYVWLNVSKMVCEVSCWRFLPGWPDEVNSDQTKTLIKNNQHYTMWETANTLKIPKSIKLLVKMKTCLLFYGKNHINFLANSIYIFTKQTSNPTLKIPLLST